MKALILMILVGIVYMLFSAMRYMMTDKGQGNRTVMALSFRIGMSVALFSLLMVLAKLGYIQPNAAPI